MIEARSETLVVTALYDPNEEDYEVVDVDPKCTPCFCKEDRGLCASCWFHEFNANVGLRYGTAGSWYKEDALKWNGKGEAKDRLRITGRLVCEKLSTPYGDDYDERFEVDKVEVL